MVKVRKWPKLDWFASPGISRQSLHAFCFIIIIIIIIIIVRMHAFGLVGLHSHSRLSSQLFDSMGNVAAPWPSIEVAHVRGFYLLGALVDW
jgi:hypothetical protein